MITAGSATLTYDPEGRLYQVAGSTTTQFLYDGADLIGEYVSNVLVRRYIQGAGTDEPLIWIEVATSEKKYLASDERGSIVAIEGSATVFNKYDAYGLPDATNTGRFQYTGQIWVGEIGLYHYKARAYNPKLGRFMQVDPIGYWKVDRSRSARLHARRLLTPCDAMACLTVFRFASGVRSFLRRGPSTPRCPASPRPGLQLPVMPSSVRSR